MGDGETGRDAGAWRGFLLLAGLVAFPAIGATIAATLEGGPIRWILAALLTAATIVLVVITVRLYRRDKADLDAVDGAGSATQTGGSGQARDWLDRIAPVGQGSYREAGGGLILFGVVTLGGGVWLLLAMPFWHQLRHLPAGPLGILAVIAGVYFLLLAVNVVRRTPK
ncbi:hypothetical protein [Herbiconiux flava]|uniref:Uncharacterized protein n=1 Tax=Herbiconiux flava TaxID=881268 RepID=A0A852SN27_9MICO|nr:hypothetical protein [Herbiconiux flava]NYD70215.1 hypothetical protein [Herbiconiux flava]GLK16967.1 hypothetical protein GCM10017602_14490 [Herbiconiux flava]